MNIHDWIDLQKDILYQSAMAQAKVVQQVLARKKQARMTESKKSLSNKELRVRVRITKGQYLSIEWLIRQWYMVNNRPRFTTRTLRKGRGFQTSSATLTKNARVGDLHAVLEAEAVFADCRRRFARLNALEKELSALGYEKP